MTIQEAINIMIKALRPLYPHQDEGVSIAQWIVSWITETTSAQLIASPQKLLTETEIETLQSVITQHVDKHKPLQYIFGSVPFLGHEILVRPPLLIPRPETEYWCSLIIEQLRQLPEQPFTILDMCTGSGCIAIGLAGALSKATVYAVDIAEKACALARENVQKNNVHVTVVQSDLFKEIPANLKFDLIVSNPPYISIEEWEHLDPSVKVWEDPTALVAHDKGLDLLKKIIINSSLRLRMNAQMQAKHIPQLVVEIGYNQGKLVQEIFHTAGFSNVVIHQDLFGKDRFVTGERHGNT